MTKTTKKTGLASSRTKKTSPTVFHCWLYCLSQHTIHDSTCDTSLACMAGLAASCSIVLRSQARLGVREEHGVVGVESMQVLQVCSTWKGRRQRQAGWLWPGQSGRVPGWKAGCRRTFSFTTSLITLVSFIDAPLRVESGLASSFPAPKVRLPSWSLAKPVEARTFPMLKLFSSSSSSSSLKRASISSASS